MAGGVGSSVHLSVKFKYLLCSEINELETSQIIVDIHKQIFNHT